ncbi:MAG: OmpA family protein [Elusimicrobia bacterium]|nr:OmpA family protein [Elusimicrobiota bacterium]
MEKSGPTSAETSRRRRYSLGIALAAAALCACAGHRKDPLEAEEARRARLELQSVLDMAASRKIPPVDFEFDKAALLPSSTTLLDKVAEILMRYQSLKVIVEGHTDDIGSDEYNDWLSAERGRAVKTYLTSKGVFPDYVKVIGYGKRRPITRDASDKGRALNRRVEFVITTREWEAVY